MREAFERWAVVEGLPVNKGSKKEYLNVKTRLAWRAWKAGVQAVMNKGRFIGEWVKCSERMPMACRDVIIITDKDMVSRVAWFNDRNDAWYVTGVGWFSRDEVTYWMPLPEPPEA